MTGSQIKKMTIAEVAKTSGKSVNSICKKAMRNYRGSGFLHLPGIGFFSITKPGKDYQLIKIKCEKSAKNNAGLNLKLIEILEELKEYVCEDCEPKIQTVIDNAKQ